MANIRPYRRGRGYGLRPADDFYSLVDDFFNRPISSMQQIIPNAQSFKMDIEENPSDYVITADLPGVSKDEVDIELNEGRLSISVEKDYDSEDEPVDAEGEEGEKSKTSQRNFVHRERLSYSASRGVYLKDAKSEGVSAQLKDGVLTVTVPKQEEDQKATKISID